jgi:predicted adenine nucleotide alpha hydrolase (AANH) superfamily ATPase
MTNYYPKFEEQLNTLKEKKIRPRLLIQACCAPCSSHCLELLTEYFYITVYYYNPNIDEYEEYSKRISELKRFVNEADFANGVTIIDGGYEPEVFYEMARGREDLPERGARCYDCYKLRMKKTAEYALEKGYDFFTTTLSISPYKNSDWINEIGMNLEREMMEHSQGKCPIFLFSDFKKKNGYKRSIELSKEYGLYRQNYCGCKFSRRDSSSGIENS